MALYSGNFKLHAEWQKALSRHLTPLGTLSYAAFTQEALYHKELGYYTRSAKRVGKSDSTDFYTASHHEIFPELMAEAMRNLLKKAQYDCSTLCELAAEPGQNIWESIDLPTEALRILRLGDSLTIPDSSVVYSNELFDAQPFQRWYAHNGQWRPIHLKLSDSFLSECLYEGPLSTPEATALSMLPEAPQMDYHIDLSLAAIELVEQIVRQDWKGLFIAVDYGKSWGQIITETPQGTARAYRNHQQVEPLYTHPGEQDLTTHVCWEHIELALKNHGFEKITCTSLSRFLMEQAQPSIERIVTSSNTLTSKRKSQLLELLTPAFFGQRFQVLSGTRF